MSNHAIFEADNSKMVYPPVMITNSTKNFYMGEHTIKELFTPVTSVYIRSHLTIIALGLILNCLCCNLLLNMPAPVSHP